MVTGVKDASNPTEAEIQTEFTTLKNEVLVVMIDESTPSTPPAPKSLAELGYTLELDSTAGTWSVKHAGTPDAAYEALAAQADSEVAALNTFQTVVTALEAAYKNTGTKGALTQELLDAKADVETVKGFQTALDEAIAGYKTAKADADTLAKFNDDIAQVEANIAEAGYKLQAAGATSNDSDVILFNNLSDNDTITGFGAKFTEGQADYLMIGDYTLVKTEIETVGATTKFGNSADALEVFAVQTSAGVDLYFEKEEAAGNLNYVAGNFTKITLAGLTNDDLNFANGIIEAAL